jgi:hypothetical protein
MWLNSLLLHENFHVRVEENEKLLGELGHHSSCHQHEIETTERNGKQFIRMNFGHNPVNNEV